MTIRAQIAKILSIEIDVSDDGEILHIDDTAGAILEAFPSLLINNDNHKIIATALRDGARGDIWYDASEYGDTGAAVLIAVTKDAMKAAAAMLHKEEEPMKTFEVQVGRDARVYYTATIEVDSLEAAKAMTTRDGFEAPEGTKWTKDGEDVFDNVETVNIYDPDTAETVASYGDGDGWEEEPEDDDPVQAYLKRMADRGDDEAKSLLA
jgi:predicted aspartyl protease